MVEDVPAMAAAGANPETRAEAVAAVVKADRSALRIAKKEIDKKQKADLLRFFYVHFIIKADCHIYKIVD